MLTIFIAIDLVEFQPFKVETFAYLILTVRSGWFPL
jgi:hypothetical protein